MRNTPISLAYALAWECYCKCPICLSGAQGEGCTATGIGTWKKNIAPLLDYNGSVRLTLTGGEPMLFWNDKTDKLFEFIKYLHENEIHVCLNTTGANMTAEKLSALDNYLDTILLSVRGLSVEEVGREFGLEEEQAKKLLDTQLMILREIHKTNIRLEVSTVVTKKNYSNIDVLGKKLCAINKNIIWRVEEYYRNGRQLKKTKGEFDLEVGQYNSLITDLQEKYSEKIFFFRGDSSQESREIAPDPFLFPDGMLYNTSNHSYTEICPVDKFDFTAMKTRRKWELYWISLRDWGWERDN